MARKKKSRMGRPPMPKGTARNERLTIRVSARELAALRAEAKRRGLTLGKLLLEPFKGE